MSTTNKIANQLRGLYAITDSQLMPGNKLLSMVEAALKGGTKIVQYRDKSNHTARRLQEASALLELCNRYDSILFINDDIQLAKTVNAPGVHIGQTDGSLAEARALLGDEVIIGVTCHDSLELAIEAQQGGADYVAFGAFFPSNTKPGAMPAPLSLLSTARQQLHVPIVAIGGITMDNAQQVIAPGADMVAVVHSLFATDDIQARAQQFNQLF